MGGHKHSSYPLEGGPRRPSKDPASAAPRPQSPIVGGAVHRGRQGDEMELLVVSWSENWPVPLVVGSVSKLESKAKAICQMTKLLLLHFVLLLSFLCERRLCRGDTHQREHLVRRRASREMKSRSRSSEKTNRVSSIGVACRQCAHLDRNCAVVSAHIALTMRRRQRDRTGT